MNNEVSVLKVIENVKLNLPKYFRQKDIDRLGDAFKKRGVLFGENGQNFTAPFDLDRFKTIDLEKAAIAITNFKVREGKILGDVGILKTAQGEEVLDYLEKTSTSFSIGRCLKRRCFNCIFELENGVDKIAPGFVTFDFSIE